MPDWALDLLKVGLPVLGSVLVAWLTARAGARKEQGDLVSRVKALEETEPAAVDEVRAAAQKATDDVEALARDVATVRAAVERVTADHAKLVADDEKRRERAAERAERREMREREQETTLAAKLATVHTLLETLRQEIRDGRSPR